MYEGTRVKLIVRNGRTLEGTIFFVDAQQIKLKQVVFHDTPQTPISELVVKSADLKDLQVLPPEKQTLPAAVTSAKPPPTKAWASGPPPAADPSAIPAASASQPSFPPLAANHNAQSHMAPVNHMPSPPVQMHQRNPGSQFPPPPPPSSMLMQQGGLLMSPSVDHRHVHNGHAQPVQTSSPQLSKAAFIDPAIVSMSSLPPIPSGLPVPLQSILLASNVPVPSSPVIHNAPNLERQQEMNPPATPTEKKVKERNGEKEKNGDKSKINYFNMNDVLDSITSTYVPNTRHLDVGEIQIRNPSPVKRPANSVNVKKVSKQDQSTFSEPAEAEEYNEDFDFVGNNAKFNKDKVFSQMLSEHNLSDVPDAENAVVPIESIPKTQFYVDGKVISAVTSDQMKLICHLSAQSTFSQNIIIENAARSICELIWREYITPDMTNPRVVVLVGVGQNGCVGLAVARQLANRNVNVIITRSRAYQLPNESVEQRKYYLECKNAKEAQIGSLPVEKVDLIIDALIGCGLRGTPLAPTSTLIQWANANGGTILSVDVPSGMEATTGAVTDLTVKPHATVALTLPKTGMNEENSGVMYVCDVGLPNGLLSGLGDGLAFPLYGSSYIKRVTC
ncbi:hypothetical protein PROFUN_00653 [Planoprotostelium fungivorum]|uniref:NAD(P)H-hydrate epimerase n=1 Tax=Planoprotostelium fungivorum TaxID=1890364 RepID=A0A2P6NU00_9EUKA|nr:hypothetical protein PROFUN_14638 [Planoprotostelium fungivorum]PRP87442.1 hypothetical protein PROFUN_00653 [Planoprotostelium fungivorum]